MRAFALLATSLSREQGRHPERANEHRCGDCQKKLMLDAEVEAILGNMSGQRYRGGTYVSKCTGCRHSQFPEQFSDIFVLSSVALEFGLDLKSCRLCCFSPLLRLLLVQRFA